MSINDRVNVPEVGYGTIQGQARGMFLVALDKLQGAVRWFMSNEVQPLNPEIKLWMQ